MDVCGAAVIGCRPAIERKRKGWRGVIGVGGLGRGGAGMWLMRVGRSGGQGWVGGLLLRLCRRDP